MDAARKHGAKKQKGNLTEDPRTQNSEENPVTKIKLPENHESDNKADLEEQKRRLNDQGRGGKV
jgi:hypothetical protein